MGAGLSLDLVRADIEVGRPHARKVLHAEEKDSMRNLFAIAAVASIALGSEAAAAPPKVIHACISKKTRAVRIVKPTVRCKRGEVRISWV